MRDNCQICHGARGGVLGNENVEDGVVMCDYCTADHTAGRPIIKGWFPIETCPRDSREMFVVRAFNIVGYATGPYMSDAYCVWRENDKFIRWPHTFRPTHWCPLPPPPQ